MEFSDQDAPTLKGLLKDSCKRFNWKEKSRIAKLYNKQGIEILEDDVQFIKADDILYLAIDGKWPHHRSKLNTPFVCLFAQVNPSTIALYWMITALSRSPSELEVLARCTWRPIEKRKNSSPSNSWISPLTVSLFGRSMTTNAFSCASVVGRWSQFDLQRGAKSDEPQAQEHHRSL